jgi:hypothetical protein
MVVLIIKEMNLKRENKIKKARKLNVGKKKLIRKETEKEM